VSGAQLRQQGFGGAVADAAVSLRGSRAWLEYPRALETTRIALTSITCQVCAQLLKHWPFLSLDPGSNARASSLHPLGSGASSHTAGDKLLWSAKPGVIHAHDQGSRSQSSGAGRMCTPIIPGSSEVPGVSTGSGPAFLPRYADLLHILAQCFDRGTVSIVRVRDAQGLFILLFEALSACE